MAEWSVSTSESGETVYLELDGETIELTPEEAQALGEDFLSGASGSPGAWRGGSW